MEKVQVEFVETESAVRRQEAAINNLAKQSRQQEKQLRNPWPMAAVGLDATRLGEVLALCGLGERAKVAQAFLLELPNNCHERDRGAIGSRNDARKERLLTPLGGRGGWRGV